MINRLVESARWAELTGFKVAENTVGCICRTCGEPIYLDDDGYLNLWPHIEPVDCKTKGRVLIDATQDEWSN